MTISLKHTFTSPVADGGDSDLVGPNEWNAEHTLTLVADRIVGRLSTDGAAQELTAAQVKTLLAIAIGDVTNLQTTLDGKQPLDSDLTAIAALSTTAYGRALLTLADAAALGALLSAIYQPLDSDLTAIAAIAPSNDDVIQRKAGAWVNRTMAQLIADLAALGTTFQPLDADLTALAGNSTDGLWAHTGAGTGAARTLSAPAAGLTITNPAGIAGNPTFALANDLAALEALGSTGLAARTGTDTWAQRTITGTAAQIAVANGDGVSGNPVISSLLPLPCGGRLTLTTAVPITESDVTGATSIFYTPALHDYIEYYNGSVWIAAQITELTLALDSTSGHTGYHQSGKNFFLGVFNDSGTIRLGSSVAWSSDTATGTGAGTCEVEMFQGRLVNKVSMTVRFGSASGNTVSVAARQFTIVGGFRATADGQATDSLTKRYVSNLQNPTIRPFRVNDAAASWNYSTNTWRQSNNSTANQFEWFHCVAGRQVYAMNAQTVGSSTATFRLVALNIGIDTVTNPPTGVGDNIGISSATFYAVRGMYTGFPGIGKHYASSMELGAGTDTQTWYSNNGINFQLQGWTLN